MDDNAPVAPDVKRGAKCNHCEDACVYLVGEEKCGGAEQQRGKESGLGCKEISASAVDPGKGQTTGEEGQGPDSNFAPADETPPDGEQQRPAVGLMRVAVSDEAPGCLQ